MSRPAETAAELRGQITDAEADAVRAASLADHLTDKRRETLLSGDDAALSRLEAELLKAERDRERARLRLDELGRRLRAAEQAKRDAAADRTRQEMADECRDQLAAAGRVDAALAEMAAAVEAWWQGELRIRARWVTDGHADRLGPIAPEFIPVTAPLMGSVPVRLANLLQLRGAIPTGHRPLAELDVAAAALARLGSPAPTEPPAVPREEPAGVSIVIGEVPPPRPEAPDDLGRLRRLFTLPTPRDPLAPPPRRV